MGKQERISATPPSSTAADKPARGPRAKPAAVAVAPPPAAPPGRNKRSEETIKQILAAAEQVILESGVERVAIQDVCDVAGLSRGTFYRYFSSQEELLDAFSKHKREKFHLALHAATAPYLVPDERFKALIAYLDNYLKHSKARRLLEVAPEFAFGFFKRIFHDSLERFQDVLAIVFDAWDARLGVKLDRALVCEMLIRYVLSELLVPREGDRRALLTSIAEMTAAIAGAGTLALPAGSPVRQALAEAPVVASAPPPGRNKRSEETIQQILVATEQVILESGVDRVSIQSVCEAAGISRGTFYRYFKAQDELLDAFTLHKRGQFHQALLDVTSPYADPDERFAALIAHLDQFLKRTKARRLLAVAPEYAFGFFQRAFLDSLDRFQTALAIVFDAWDERLGVKLDRALVCEMIIRYVLSELLVQGEGKRHQIPQRIAALIAGIGGGRAAAPKERKAAEVRLPAHETAVAPEPGRSKRSDQTIAQILAATEEVILESGVERVSILAVCETAGVSRGTFYRYFSSQEQLLDAFTEAQHALFHQTLVEAAAPHTEPEARFQAVMAHMDHFLRRDKVRRLLEIAPEYAFGFFQRTFEEAIDGFERVLDVVFDAWEERLDTTIDRRFACELLVRYMLSELLVPTDAGTPLLPLRLGRMFGAVLGAQGR
jgi:AcrR family transcriptional regulator